MKLNPWTRESMKPTNSDLFTNLRRPALIRQLYLHRQEAKCTVTCRKPSKASRTATESRLERWATSKRLVVKRMRGPVTYLLLLSCSVDSRRKDLTDHSSRLGREHWASPRFTRQNKQAASVRALIDQLTELLFSASEHSVKLSLPVTTLATSPVSGLTESTCMQPSGSRRVHEFTFCKASQPTPRRLFNQLKFVSFIWCQSSNVPTPNVTPCIIHATRRTWPLLEHIIHDQAFVVWV